MLLLPFNQTGFNHLVKILGIELMDSTDEMKLEWIKNLKWLDKMSKEGKI